MILLFYCYSTNMKMGVQLHIILQHMCKHLIITFCTLLSLPCKVDVRDEEASWIADDFEVSDCFCDQITV